MIRYVVTTFPDRATLSRDGDWGNLPFPDAAAAREAARQDAGSAPHHIRQVAAPRRKDR